MANCWFQPFRAAKGKKSKSTRESFILTAIEFVMGKKSKPKQLNCKVNAFKWKGFISLDCVYGNIYSFCYAQRSRKLESVRLFNASLTLAVAAAAAAAQRTEDSLSTKPNASRYASLCWIPYVRIQFSRANLTSHSSRYFLFIFRRSNPLCSVYTCDALPTLFSSFNSSSHSNYAAPIPPKLENIPTTIPLFCTYIKHRNHFPYQTCIVVRMCQHT